MNDINQDSITAAIVAASRVAAIIPPALPAPPFSGHVRTLEDALASAGAYVDVWLSLEANAFRIGTTLVPCVEGVLDPYEVRFPYMVRCTIAGVTQFARSYDGVREVQSGRPWAEVCAQAQSLDHNCQGQYDAAEIALALTADLTLPETTYFQGSRVGVTTPVTGYRPFMHWLRVVCAQPDGKGPLHVRASVEPKTRAGVKPWGLPVFALLDRKDIR